LREHCIGHDLHPLLSGSGLGAPTARVSGEIVDGRVIV
jgi:hypothetical protein